MTQTRSNCSDRIEAIKERLDACRYKATWDPSKIDDRVAVSKFSCLAVALPLFENAPQDLQWLLDEVVRLSAESARVDGLLAKIAEQKRVLSSYRDLQFDSAALVTENARLRMAFEKCKEQRNEWIESEYGNRLTLIERADAELKKILEAK